MKKLLITMIALILVSLSSAAFAQQWKITRAIFSMDSDLIPLDTANTGLKIYGNLFINNGMVQMSATVCGVTCTDNTSIIEPTKIFYSDEYVAILETGEEVNIIQIEPELIISVHIPYIETSVYFLEPVK